MSIFSIINLQNFKIEDLNTNSKVRESNAINLDELTNFFLNQKLIYAEESDKNFKENYEIKSFNDTHYSNICSGCEKPIDGQVSLRKEQFKKNSTLISHIF